MPLLIWGGVALAGAVALDKAGDAAEQTSKLARWAVIGGALYVGYRAAQSGGLVR